ncbi:inositol 2-dehydrogenase [Psychromicrobium lacuslunae]|uniref:Inositol 2-dehydrogenase n=1 Tax=Psychromicrobium lacuslunae TaxID=1618207 RepID=A0A0D4C3H8_9MICC|nr:inositol 2-dehydrogenase [Psychromicrobium lacuslunae]
MKVAVIGAGRMGADHISRLEHKITGASVAAVVDIDLARASAAAESVGARALATLGEALALPEVNAVLIATPGFLHEEALLEALAHDLPILCEKPLTPDAASAWRVVQAEVALGRKRIQVGFMRQFDAGYQKLKRIIAEGEKGQLLMLHCAHRNPDTLPDFTESMLITDSVVHEFDAIRFLSDEEIASVQVRRGRGTSLAPEGIDDPQQVLIETESGLLADVEIFVNARYGYEVATQAVFENGTVNIGLGEVTPSFIERFGDAYDVEVQRWVDAARRGEIGGPSAWDGYATAACCEAGVAAQHSSGPVRVELADKPELYR